MPLLAEPIAWLCIALEATLVVGLIVRRRVRESYMLFLLTLAWLASALVVGLCRACLTWRFWIITELVHAALAFLLALELVWRAFRQVPRAWWWARVLVALSAVVGAALVSVSRPGPVSVHVVPWLLAALACLYMGLWLIPLALDMPQEPLHAAILAGLSPYLIVYALTWGQTGSDTTIANLVNPVMFACALVILVRTAWSREIMAPAAHPETIKWLFPWRS